MPGWCWDSSADRGPALQQHWFIGVRVALLSQVRIDQCWLDVGKPSTTLDQHQGSIGSTTCVCWDVTADAQHWLNCGSMSHTLAHNGVAIGITFAVCWNARVIPCSRIEHVAVTTPETRDFDLIWKLFLWIKITFSHIGHDWADTWIMFEVCWSARVFTFQARFMDAVTTPQIETLTCCRILLVNEDNLEWLTNQC